MTTPHLNGVTIFESLSFPLAADLVITLESGHRYSVIVEGNYSGGEVSFILIDGTELIPQQVKSGTIVVNFTSDALDVVINNEGMTADIASGTSAYVPVPDTEFVVMLTLAGSSDDILFSGNFVPFPNVMLLGVVCQETSGDLQTIFHRWSDLTIVKFLRDAANNP